MGLLDWLTGNKPAPAGVKRRSETELREALMAVNRKSAPFKVRSGAKEGVDLVAEWRIADARWHEAFADAGVKRVLKILMKFDSAKGEVRASDQEWQVAWRDGVPELVLSASAFRGRTWEMSFDADYGFREDGSFGKLGEYRFDTGAIKGPLTAAVHASGWGWRAIAFAKL